MLCKNEANLKALPKESAKKKKWNYNCTISAYYIWLGAHHLVSLIQAVYTYATAKTRVHNKEFSVKSRCRQGRMESPMSINIYFDSVLMMMKMMVNCFCRMVDQRKALSLISKWDHCERFSPLQISDTLRVGFEPAQNQGSDFVEWSCVVVLITTPWHQNHWQYTVAPIYGANTRHLSCSFSCTEK